MKRNLIIVTAVILYSSLASGHDLPGLFGQYMDMDQAERDAVALARQSRQAASKSLSTISPTDGLLAVIRKHSTGAWNNGTTISACFYTGVTQTLRQKLISVAHDWIVNANLKIDFGGGPNFRSCNASGGGNIRIDVGGSSSFSQVGTDANLINKSKHTLNIASDVASNPESSFFYTTALHEWGHALGFEHEHQSPLSNCNFDKKAIYADMAQYGWSKETVDENFDKLVGAEASAVNAFPFDPNSIMIYSLPANYFVNGTSPCLVGQPGGLSDEDKQAMQQTYSFSATQISRATLDAIVKSSNVDTMLKSSILNSITRDTASFSIQ